MEEDSSNNNSHNNNNNNNNNNTGVVDSTTAQFLNETLAIVIGPSSPQTVILLSGFFFLIEMVGIIGNGLVIFVVLSNKKMRTSVTNMFIMNLAVADLLLLLIGIPDLVQFVLNRGWILNLVWCKAIRYILVVSLYASVMTLVAVCVERFIAIVYPIKAHILCSKKKVILTIICIWPIALICGLPTVIYNGLRFGHPTLIFCTLMFPKPYEIMYRILYKYTEAFIYFYFPIAIQIVLYSIIARRLFVSAKELTTRFQMRPENNRKSEKSHEAVKARRGVVKMLMACVIIYVLSYLPPQILLFYNTFAAKRFESTWSFRVFSISLSYINSAANPVLYSIFSQNFRKKFRLSLCFICTKLGNGIYRRPRSGSFDSHLTSRPVSSLKTSTSKL
ncbi:neuropeptide receptor 15 [Argonauta hians]